MPSKKKTVQTVAPKADTDDPIEKLIDDLCAHGDRYIHADDGAYTVRLVEGMNRERALWASAYFDRIVSKLGHVAEYRSTLKPEVFDVRSYLPRLIQLAVDADEQLREQDVGDNVFDSAHPRFAGVEDFDIDPTIPF